MPSTAKIASSGVATVSTGGSRIPRSERPVKGRRGTLYHLSSIIEEQQHGATTLDDVKVRRRFATSRYFLSPAGILKLLVIVSKVQPVFIAYRYLLKADNTTSEAYFNS